MKLRLLAALFAPVIALAQTAPQGAPGAPGTPQGPVNLVKNGDFAKTADEENLWDGVDSEGFLAGDTYIDDTVVYKGGIRPAGIFYNRYTAGRVDAILEGGNIGRLPLPISVQVADLNRDGLLDLITVDGAKYFRIYFNSGTPTEPKFTHCEMVPVFLARFPWTKQRSNYGRFAAEGLKLALGDITKNGTLDMVLGNYFGDLMILKNTGSLTTPEWKQPPSFEAIRVPTTRDGHLWANLLAPAVYDWNRDGKPDILVGEGSYSANAVHLLLNGGSGFGSNSMPTFSEEMTEYLAYGDGREQLVPAVVDYNGDGIPDLLVGDRTGNINVYLSNGLWKKGAELQRQPQPISFGGVTSIGAGNPFLRCVSPTVADLNGDGKFDIIVGKPSGRIAVSYNIGTAQEPKFGPLVELKGEKVFKKGSIRSAADWEGAFGYTQGNFYGTYNVVTPEEDPEAAQATGKRVFKFFYSPSQNKIVRRQPFVTSPPTPMDNIQPWAGFHPNAAYQYWGAPVGGGAASYNSNVAILRQQLPWNAVKPNVRYTLSFRVKGRNVRDAHAVVYFAGWLIRNVEASKVAGESPDNRVCEALGQNFDISAGPTWNLISKQITFRFKNADLNQPDKWSKAGSKIEFLTMIGINGTVASEDGAFYIDDVKLTPM